MDEKTLEALSEVAKAAARQMGLDDSEISFTVCNTTEPNTCDKQCNICEGQTHHWMEGFEEDEDGEIINPDNPIWKCKHCDYVIPYGEPEKHPSGCDCPDCLPEEAGYKTTTCLICHRVYQAEIMEEPCPYCGAGFQSQIFEDEDYPEPTEDFDDSECWLCGCGAFITDGLHCSTCGGEPPWGCPCSFCQSGDDEIDAVSYSDVMREDWDY